MNYIDKILKKFEHFSPVEKRIASFNYVRDLEYKITKKQDPYLLYLNKKGDCAAKSKLLSLLFKKLRYKTRPMLIKYKLRKFPKEVKYIPDQIDYHHAMQIKIGNIWITLDATYDSALSSKKFIVNSWDGYSNTKLAVNPITIKIGKKKNIKFDRDFKLFIKKLINAYKENPNNIKKYTSEFNNIISKLRK